MNEDVTYMQAALEDAQKAALKDEVPIGAIVVDSRSGDIITRGNNLTREMNDPTAHAEILALREACSIAGAQRIPEYDLYVTLEPCTMCAAAISFARIRRLIIGAPDAKGGGVLHGARFYDQPTCHHKPEVTSNVLAEECGTLLQEFFKQKRALKRIKKF